MTRPELNNVDGGLNETTWPQEFFTESRSLNDRYFPCVLVILGADAENDQQHDGVVLVGESINEAGEFAESLIQQSKVRLG